MITLLITNKWLLQQEVAQLFQWVTDFEYYPEDYMAEDEILEWARYKKDTVIFTKSSIVFGAFRVAVKKEWLSQLEIFFIDQEKPQFIHTPSVNSDGRLDYWPDGMFDTFDKFLDELL